MRTLLILLFHRVEHSEDTEQTDVGGSINIKSQRLSPMAVVVEN